MTTLDGATAPESYEDNNGDLIIREVHARESVWLLTSFCYSLLSIIKTASDGLHGASSVWWCLLAHCTVVRLSMPRVPPVSTWYFRTNHNAVKLFLAWRRQRCSVCRLEVRSTTTRRVLLYHFYRRLSVCVCVCLSVCVSLRAKITEKLLTRNWCNMVRIMANPTSGSIFDKIWLWSVTLRAVFSILLTLPCEMSTHHAANNVRMRRG